MALGRPTRFDTMRYSYCSTATIGVFVSLCLIGVWMMTSSTVVTVDMSSTERNAEMRHQVSESNSTPFEDNQGDLPEDIISRDANNNVKTSGDESNEEYTSKLIDNLPDESNEDNAATVNKGMKDTWEDGSKSYNDVNGNGGSGESNSDGGQKDAGGEDGQDKAADQNSGGALDDNQEKNKQPDSDESDSNFVQENTQTSPDVTGNNEQENNLDQNFDPAIANEQDNSEKSVNQNVDNEMQKEVTFDGGVDNEMQKEVKFDGGVQNEMQKEVTFDGGVDNGMQKEVKFDGGVDNEMQKELTFNDGVENERQKEVTFDGGVENERQQEVTFDGGVENEMQKELAFDDANAQDENTRDQMKGVAGQSQRDDSEQRHGGNDLQNQKKEQVTFEGGVENEVQTEVTFDGGNAQDENNKDQMKDVAGQTQMNDAEHSSDGNDLPNQKKDQALNEVFPQLELLNETNAQNGAWSTQAAESNKEKLVQASSDFSQGQMLDFPWKLCNSTAGADYIPCLDNEAAIKKLQSTKHYEHRERHCPEEAPTCLVPIPDRYRQSIEWPKSRDKIWYYNVPHTKLADFKGHQNWVKVSGENLIFPGGGTQFKNGALHYVDQIQEALPDIAWGKRSRVVLDVGCGVASFGGYLFDRDALTMSFAPKDEHEAQVQFALERGIPAVLNVMGTKRLPYPSRVFDVIHCARCRVPWHIEGGKLLLEINRLLRPGGYFVWSATPVYQAIPADVEIWEAMSALTKSMCWDMVKKTKDTLNGVGIAIYRKPLDNTCYDKREEKNPPVCEESDDPNAAWNISLQACMHRLPSHPAERGAQWPEQWPLRLGKVPYWLNNSQIGVYGKAAVEDFNADYEHWKHVVKKSYLSSMGINWGHVRNVMDMRSVYGGFAAALRDMKVWVMNVVTTDSPDTLPIIYERGLFGIYHDWCESFSTYPRSYDLLHADHLFSQLKSRCKLLPVLAEVDRILRPEGKLIVRDKVEIIDEIENIAKSLHWDVRIRYSKSRQGLVCIQKTMWRPKEIEAATSS